MDLQLAAIVALTFVISLIETVAYAFRIAGVRTGSLAVASSLFNILVLVSRTANALQVPILAKRVETALHDPGTASLAWDLHLVLASTSVATIVGAAMIPSMERVATVATESFRNHRSVPRLLLRFLTPQSLMLLGASVTLPRREHWIHWVQPRRGFPLRIVVLNFAATALWTVGLFAAIYAGSIAPDFRVTSISLSSVINALATIVMFTLVDPYLSGLTDDAAQGKIPEQDFYHMVLWMLISRFAGTLAAQFLLVPGAYLIALVAHWI